MFSIIFCTLRDFDFFHLQKLVNFPASDKYFFRIARIGRGIESSPYTFKSLKTGEFLHCDIDGKAFMKPKAATDGRGLPKDIQTFFNLWPCKHTRVIKHDEHMVLAQNAWLQIGQEEEEEGEIPMDQEDGTSELILEEETEILEPLDGHCEYQAIRIYVSTV